MKSNTKLVVFIKNKYEKASKKFLIFKVYFTSSIFFLFFGFLTGNLFGNLLNIFSKSFLWPGLVTVLIIMVVETINYLRYRNKNRRFFLLFIFRDILNIRALKNLSFAKYSKIKNIYYINLKKKLIYSFKNLKAKLVYIKKFVFGNFLNTIISLGVYIVQKPIFHIYSKHFVIICLVRENIDKKYLYNKFTKQIFIKNINLFKIGILFGFFIDAFKVGS